MPSTFDKPVWIVVGRSLPGLEGQVVDARAIHDGEYGEIYGDVVAAPDDPRIPQHEAGLS